MNSSPIQDAIRLSLFAFSKSQSFIILVFLFGKLSGCLMHGLKKT